MIFAALIFVIAAIAIIGFLVSLGIGLVLIIAVHVFAFFVGGILAEALEGEKFAFPFGGILGLIILWIGLALWQRGEDKRRAEEAARKKAEKEAEERRKRREQREQERQRLLAIKQKREDELAKANPITRKVRTWLGI